MDLLIFCVNPAVDAILYLHKNMLCLPETSTLCPFVEKKKIWLGFVCAGERGGGGCDFWFCLF